METDVVKDIVQSLRLEMYGIVLRKYTSLWLI